jgi:hypothetical protein
LEDSLVEASVGWLIGMQPSEMISLLCDVWLVLDSQLILRDSSCGGSAVVLLFFDTVFRLGESFFRLVDFAEVWGSVCLFVIAFEFIRHGAVLVCFVFWDSVVLPTDLELGRVVGCLPPPPDVKLIIIWMPIHY